MMVMGIQRGHDAGVCLMKEGKILCVVESERVFRIKHADGPGTIAEAARTALEDAGVGASEIDRIVLADNYRDAIERNHSSLVVEMHGPGLLAPLGTVGNIAFTGGDLGILGLRSDAEVYGVCHHAAHAAGAIYMSGFDECVAYAYDGYGTCCGTVGYGYANHRLHRIEETRDRILIGWRYQLIAHFIREIDKQKTKPTDLAGKIMGLNAFGETASRVVETLKVWLRKGYKDYEKSWDSTTNYWFPGLVNERGFGRDQHSAQDADFLQLLASLQAAIDEVVCEEVAQILAIENTRRVAVVGGCAYNILTNTALRRALPDKEIFTPPNAGDSGLAMGAAVIGSADESTGLHFPQIALEEKRTPYKGPFITGLKRNRQSPATFNPDALDAIVATLTAGGIVGLVKGRLEIGPRALGNRSLLADATHAGMREILNHRVKKREWWRPFAPVARSVDAHLYFDFDVQDQYMLLPANVRHEWRERLSAVTHRDNTARLQVIPDEAANPELWYILTRLQESTGVGVCLNTSLNLGGRPIINSMDEVHELLANQDIDFMYVEGNIIKRRLD